MSALRIAHGADNPRAALEGGAVDVLVDVAPAALLEDDGTLLTACLARRVKVVVRVGPHDATAASAAADLHAVVTSNGLDAVVAHVEGDDLLPRRREVWPYLGAMPATPTAAWAELGAWGIVEALDGGADIVVVGHVSPAATVVGPAAWHFGWTRQDWDEIAGAVVAGQVLAGGTRCTGADYAFFEEVPRGAPVAPPVVEVRSDGSAIVTKHPDTSGTVDAGTVVAQVLDGGRGLEHADPDATVRRNSVRIAQDEPDRVLIHSVRGLPGPETAVVTLEAAGGLRRTVTVMLTGIDLDAKADAIQDALWDELGGSSSAIEVQLRPIDEDQAALRITATSADPARVGSTFTAAVEVAAGACPGALVVPGPGEARPFSISWCSQVPTDQVAHVAIVGEQRVDVAPAPTKPPALQRRTRTAAPREPAARKVAPTVSTHPETISTLLEDLNRRRLTAGAADDDSVHWDSLPMAHVPLGRLAGARSGIAGADATIGIWVPSEDAYDWLQWYLSVDRFQGLLPADLEGLELERFELPNINALSFVVVDVLPAGADASLRHDPTARSLGEHVRARVVDIPEMLLAR